MDTKKSLLLNLTAERERVAARETNKELRSKIVENNAAAARCRTTAGLETALVLQHVTSEEIRSTSKEIGLSRAIITSNLKFANKHGMLNDKDFEQSLAALNKIEKWSAKGLKRETEADRLRKAEVEAAATTTAKIIAVLKDAGLDAAVETIKAAIPAAPAAPAPAPAPATATA